MNKNQVTIVEEDELDKPDNHEIEYLLDDNIKVCKNQCFHTFEYRLVYDIHFTSISNTAEVNFTITFNFLELETEFNGLNLKNQKCSRNRFYI